MATHVKQVFYVASQSNTRSSYVNATQSKDYANEFHNEFQGSDALVEHLTPTKGLMTDDNCVVHDDANLLYLREKGEGIWI